MPKLTGFLAMLLLAGSTNVVQVEMSPFRTTVTVPGEIVERFVYSPLTERQWVRVHTSQSVPAFATGTSIDEVRNGLIARNLLVLREWPGFMVVREGVPLIDMSGPARQNFLYGFENDGLVLGPLTFQDVMNAFVEAGMTPERM